MEDMGVMVTHFLGQYHIHLSHHPNRPFVSVPISFAWQANELSPYRKCADYAKRR
mgnify:CR=1 FL=1